MANTKSALKRIRQTATRTARNRATTSKLKTLRKKISTAVETADKEAAAAAYNTTAPPTTRARPPRPSQKSPKFSLRFSVDLMASRSVYLSGLFLL